MWTQAAYALVEREWTAGLSASQISAKLAQDLNLRKTRNAVIGVVHRRKLPQRLNPHRTITPKHCGGPNIPATRSRRQRIFNAAMASEKPAPPAAPIPVEPLHIPFLDRETYQCRAITDPTRYAQKVCGHPIEGTGVYCRWHHSLHNVPADPKKKPRARA